MSFPTIFANAAGWVKSVEGVRKLCGAPITHIVVGSFTIHPRDGNNEGTNYVAHDGTTTNSLGLPNPGIEALFEMLPEMLALTSEAGKKLVVSIAGFTTKDFVQATSLLADHGVEIIEYNLGCPNVFNNGKHKRIIAFDPPLVNDILYHTERTVRTQHLKVKVWVKVSPYTDPYVREMVAATLRIYSLDKGHVVAVVACNTIPNHRPLAHDGKPELGVSNGYGGMGGKEVKSLALLNAADFVVQLADTDIVVIGCGGIAGGADLADYERAGCIGAQVGSAYFESDDPRVFQHILMDNVDGEIAA